jgi:hypothetical protein
VTDCDLQHRKEVTTQSGVRCVPSIWLRIQHALIAVTMQHWWITLFPFVALRIAGWM